MPLPWVRLDTSFPRNPKLLALLGDKDGHRAGLVYICSLAYAGEQGTDGFIPAEALPHLHGRAVDAARLASVRLWIVQPGGWLINGWADFQESSADAQTRRKRAQALAAARWNGHEAMTDAERARKYRERKKDGHAEAG